MRLILTRMIFNFDMTLAEPDVDWENQECYTLWTKSPLMIKITECANSQKSAD